MAQLIKLNDYISRYEWNIYRYPSQYIRLKQENWNKTYQAWKQGNINNRTSDDLPSQYERSTLTKIKEFLFMKHKHQHESETEVQDGAKVIRSEFELRQYFLDEMFPFQLKWATSTVTDKSILAKDYEQDTLLKYFLQRFPDIYLIMYYPLFHLKNAQIDGEIIMISPSEIEIITVMEFNHQTTIMAGDDRSWAIEQASETKDITSPLIKLRRTEHIIRSILNHKQLQYPIKKTVLSRMNQIIFTTEPYKTNIIGSNQYDQWFDQKRKLSAPLKSEQLKVAEALLSYCMSHSVKRPEWDKDSEPFMVGE